MNIGANFYKWMSIFLVIVFIISNNAVTAQVDTMTPVQADTTNPAQVDTTGPLQVDTTGKNKKVKDQFIVYAGANLNNINVSSNQFDAHSSVGYHLGIAYKRGKFFYWQIGARYDNIAYKFVSEATASDSSKLNIGAIDVPVTVGINFLSFVNRLLALRVFISAVPSFNFHVDGKDLGITKDDINSFVFYGQAGIGIDVAFVLVDVGYNYGFQSLVKDYSNSNPGQAFVSLGFRF